MSDIIIVDQEFIDEGTNSVTWAESFEEELLKNIGAMTNAKQAWQGDTADKFKILIDQLEMMKGIMDSLSKEEKALIEQFIKEIDTADQYLYD